MIRDIFTSDGFEVVGEAAHGIEAVEKYRELKPDLTTMDIVMPYKSGIEATREIVRVDPRAVVIICSALGQESLVMEAIEAGAADFIVKPFRAEDVLAVVKKVLGETPPHPKNPRGTPEDPPTGGPTGLSPPKNPRGTPEDPPTGGPSGLRPKE
jgi:two-component system chemotaxis response regulator CheY